IVSIFNANGGTVTGDFGGFAASMGNDGDVSGAMIGSYVLIENTGTVGGDISGMLVDIDAAGSGAAVQAIDNDVTLTSGTADFLSGVYTNVDLSDGATVSNNLTSGGFETQV